MAANPIDRSRLKLCRSLNIDGVRPRRHAADPAKRSWYARHRAERFARR